MDYKIMDELMQKLNGQCLPYKDLNQMPSKNATWDILATKRNFTPKIIQNIWKDMIYFAKALNQLSGFGNAMSPSFYKTLNNGKIL